MKAGKEGQRRGKEKIAREHIRYTRSYPHRVIIKLGVKISYFSIFLQVE